MKHFVDPNPQGYGKTIERGISLAANQVTIKDIPRPSGASIDKLI